MADLTLNVRTIVQGQKHLKNLGDDLSLLGRNLTLGVTLPLAAAGAAFVTMASEAEESEAKLESVFDTMQASAWTTVDALNAQAEALAKSTTFDDDAVREAQAVLLTFSRVTGETFDTALEHSADLAAFWETDMNDAALQLGKALQDPIGGLTALRRQGLIFSEEQEAAIRAFVEAGDIASAQGIILEEVGRQVGSVAEDLANTTGGKMQQALIQLGEAGEAAGAILLPVLATMAGALTAIAGVFLSLDPGIQGFIVTVLAIVAAIGPVILAIRGLVAAFGVAQAAFGILTAVFALNPFVLLIAAIIALVALIILNWDKIVESFKNLFRDISNVMGALGRFLSGVWDAITGAARAAWQGLGNIIKGAINVVIGLINGFIGFINGIQIHIPAIGVGPIQTPAFDWWGLRIPKIPYLAEGGIITDPTLAMLAERGPEAVIPLDQLQQGVTVNVNVSGDLKAEERTLPGTILRGLYVAGLAD